MWSLRHKLLLSYALLVLGVLAGAGWSIYHFVVLGRSVRRIMANNYRSVLAAQNMKETLERQDSAMTFHLAGNDEKAIPQYRLNRGRFAASYRDAAANITEAGEVETIRDIGGQFGRFSRLAAAFLRSRPRSPAEQRAVYFRDLEPAFLRLKGRCQDLLELNQAAMVRGQHRAEVQATAATRATVVLALVLLALGILYSINLSRALVAPLARLTRAARWIGEGDLSLRIDVRTGDEVEVLAEEFNRMTARLREYREREAARLQVAEQQAEEAIDNLYEPVIVTGADGEVVDLNQAAEGLFGEEEGWRSRPVEELGVAPLARAVREAVAHHRPVAREGASGLAAIRADHGERQYRLRTVPLLRPAAADGGEREIAGTVTVLEDVTRLRELDRLKDEFISVASHELRTPLTSMQMAVQLLAEGSTGPLTEKQERLVRMASADAERLDRLTRDLLDLTRLEAGTAVPDRQPVSPLEVAEAGTGPVRNQAREKGVELEIQVAPELPPVLGDLDQLSRVVTNLVGNAVRHTPPGGRVLVEGDVDGRQVRFTVTDTGQGIPAEYLPRIFERFVQVPGATSGGAGLGLPIAKRIVEAHGGTIRAEAVPGQGARFQFAVPVHEG